MYHIVKNKTNNLSLIDKQLTTYILEKVSQNVYLAFETTVNQALFQNTPCYKKKQFHPSM